MLVLEEEVLSIFIVHCKNESTDLESSKIYVFPKMFSKFEIDLSSVVYSIPWTGLL